MARQLKQQVWTILELGAQVKENDKEFSGGARGDQDRFCNIKKTRSCL